MEAYNIIDVNAENVADAGLFCIKNKKAPGYSAKLDWFKQKCNEGLGIKLLETEDGKPVGFVEFIPAEKAWRPVQAKNYLFIHCIVVQSKSLRSQGLASRLIYSCEEEARKLGKSGICVMASDGVWIADKRLFQRNGFEEIEKSGRFELMVKKFDPDAEDPKLIEWESKAVGYQGWHILYADQCPWHVKSVEDLLNAAMDMDIDLNVTHLTDPSQARQMPCGYGTFALIHNGEVLADHYISQTRFRNIVRKRDLD